MYFNLSQSKDREIMKLKIEKGKIYKQNIYNKWCGN